MKLYVWLMSARAGWNRRAGETRARHPFGNGTRESLKKGIELCRVNDAGDAETLRELLEWLGPDTRTAEKTDEERQRLIVEARILFPHCGDPPNETTSTRPEKTKAVRAIDCTHERARVTCPDCGIDIVGSQVKTSASPECDLCKQGRPRDKDGWHTSPHAAYVWIRCTAPDVSGDA